MTSEAKLKLAQLEQGLEQFAMQKKQFQQQLIEIDSSLAALSSSKQSFKIIGNLLIEQPGKQLQEELLARQETLQVRVQSIEKQEEKLRAQVKEAQEAVLEEVKKEK